MDTIEIGLKIKDHINLRTRNNEKRNRRINESFWI